MSLKSAFIALAATLTFVGAAHANTGTVYLRNGTTTNPPGTIKFDSCVFSAPDNCTGTTTPEATQGSTVHAARVTNNNQGTGTIWGVTSVYIKFTPKTYTPVLAMPNCTLAVNVSSNQNAYWTGTVTVTKTSDFGRPYTPTCTYSNFSVNSTTGDWTVQLNWTK